MMSRRSWIIILQNFGKECGCAPELTAEGRDLLLRYRWPGNVRELVNVVERLVVLTGDPPLTPTRCAAVCQNYVERGR